MCGSMLPKYGALTHTALVNAVLPPGTRDSFLYIPRMLRSGGPPSRPVTGLAMDAIGFVMEILGWSARGRCVRRLDRLDARRYVLVPGLACARVAPPD